MKEEERQDIECLTKRQGKARDEAQSFIDYEMNDIEHSERNAFTAGWIAGQKYVHSWYSL